MDYDMKDEVALRLVVEFLGRGQGIGTLSEEERRQAAYAVTVLAYESAEEFMKARENVSKGNYEFVIPESVEQ